MKPEEIIFAMYFSGIASFQFHPKNQDNPVRLSLEECSEIAARMLFIHNKFFGE